MSPEQAAQYIRVGLCWHYMIITSPSNPGTISAVCPATCALARKMERERPDLVAGVYDRTATAGDIAEDLQAMPGKRRG